MLFAGLTFAFSGRNPWYTICKDHVKEYGGMVANSLTKAVDILISTDEDVKAKSKSILTARERGIPILRLSYILHCVEFGERQGMDKYTFNGVGLKKKPAHQAAVSLANPSTSRKSSRDVEELPLDRPCSEAASAHVAVGKSLAEPRKKAARRSK
mmetsp:Transcript_4993/g.14606  ORF Transcript_4993/g.14606 Transcript_4993/m.14606 type:complete len:155 (+) Transcript_4993:83-547(+)